MAKLVKSESLGAISSSHEDEVDQGPLDPCNVFVKYLPQELRDSDLSALFATFGEVISSKIMLDPASRKSLGFGFVRFETPDQAGNAITGMNGHRLGPKRLLCKLAKTPKEKEPIPVSAGKATSDDSPRARPVSTSNTARGSSTASSESLTVTVSSSRTLPSVSRSSSTPNLPSNNPRPYAKASNSSAQRKHSSTNLYITGLQPSDTEQTLQELFGTHGEIEGCKVMLDKFTGLSRCIGFVRFRTHEQASKAMQSIQGLQRGESTLSIKFADDDKQREIRKRLRLAAGAANTQVPSPASYGMLARHGSFEGSVDAMRSFVPLSWPYSWPATPVYAPPSVYDPSSWLFMYSPDSYSSPRSAPTPFAFSPHSMYFAYDSANSPPDQLNILPRSYAHTAPLPTILKLESDVEPVASQDGLASSAPSH